MTATAPMATSPDDRRPSPALARAARIVLMAAVAITVARAEAATLIRGDSGNTPIADPGWPSGAAPIFNHESRIAWWEGPPFGGGQWHAECRGEAKTFNAILADFAKLDVKNKKVVVHDGVGESFWLNPNREPAKKAAAKMDWSFTVWQPGHWERMSRMPADLNPTDKADVDKGPPARVDVYAGGNIKWADVTVPKGLDVDDQRLEAHGFQASDGTVLEGRVFDLATKAAIPSATMRLELIEPQQKGGYKHTTKGSATGDAQGRWVQKNAPAGWYRLVVEADGYVPRIAGHARFDGQPLWQSYATGLAKPAAVSGRVTDADGKPLADVEVQLGNVESDNAHYESPDEYTTKTDADGRFLLKAVPTGRATVWVRKPGYTRPGLGPTIPTPKEGVALTMMKSATLRVTVTFAAGKARPAGYMVSLEPEGGAKIGSWGGSGDINAKNQMLFEHVPPGRYVIKGRPNPGSDNEETAPVTVTLRGGETTELKLDAK